MSATVIGNATQLANGILQPNATVTYESDGTITGFARYAYAQSASPAPLGSDHPDDSRATVISFTLEFDESFQYANCQYRGVWSSSACRVEVQATLQANPIETHPNFTSTLGGTPGSPLNGAVFDSNGVFLGWPAGAALGLGGVRYFLVAANTYRFTFSTTSGATVSSAVSSIGALASSVSAGGLTISQSNGFMLQNVTEQHQYVGAGVTVYIYTVCWVSTQPPGWNTNIYPP